MGAMQLACVKKMLHIRQFDRFHQNHLKGGQGIGLAESTNHFNHDGLIAQPGAKHQLIRMGQLTGPHAQLDRRFRSIDDEFGDHLYSVKIGGADIIIFALNVLCQATGQIQIGKWIEAKVKPVLSLIQGFDNLLIRKGWRLDDRVGR
jgi:hypothetical protein